jgi:hypothetical protein
MCDEPEARPLELAIGDYAPIRADYRGRIYSAVLEYLTGNRAITTYKNAAKQAAAVSFGDAADLGFVDGGGTLPDQMLNDFVGARQDKEFGNLDALFQQLKELRADEDFTNAEAFDIANARADGYALTLDAIYNEAKLRGARNRMLTFGGVDGHSPGFPCKTCKRLKGQRHRASWWVRRGLIPYPGNENFECGAWQCKHFLYDDNGRAFTL